MIFDNKTQFHPTFNGEIWIVFDVLTKTVVVECLSRHAAIDAALELNAPAATAAA